MFDSFHFPLALLIAIGFAVAGCDDHDQGVAQKGALHDLGAGKPPGQSGDSFFVDRSNLEVTIAHKISGNKLVVTASVINKSDESITFVYHPDFWSIAVYAADRNNDEAINSGQFFHYHRATQENLMIVTPQAAAQFEQSFVVRRKPGGVTEVEDYPQFSDLRSYMRISDRDLQITFHYGVYPKRLPEEAGSLARNYVMVEIGARKNFQLPLSSGPNPQN